MRPRRPVGHRGGGEVDGDTHRRPAVISEKANRLIGSRRGPVPLGSVARSRECRRPSDRVGYPVPPTPAWRAPLRLSATKRGGSQGSMARG
jgi:hypothetical protein